jgi:hypothetical protein
MKIALLTLFACAAAVPAQEPPPDVMELFRSAGVALAEANTRAFLDKFDSSWSGFAQVRDDVTDLLTRFEVGSTIDVVTDQGDDSKRTLELDWLLTIEGVEQRRKVVKCTIEKQGKKWKITALEPNDFFKASRK